MEVARDAVAGRVHVHGGDDDPVRELQRADPHRLEHRRPDAWFRPAVRRALRAGERARPAVRRGPLAVRRAALAVRRALLTGEPPVHPRDELGVAQPQVVVGDPAAAGDDVERELLRVLAGVLADVLEPLQAGLRRALGGRDHGAPLRLVGRGRRRDVRLLVQAGCEGQRVLHRQFGPGPDGEVRGVRGVAEQHHVVVPPGRAPHRGEVHPAGVVADDLVATQRWPRPRRPAQDVRTDLPDDLDRRLVAAARRQVRRGRRQAREPGPVPHVVAGLQDERARVPAVWVAMDLHHPGGGVQDVELERVEDQVGAEPDVGAAASLELRPEHRGQPLPGL